MSKKARLNYAVDLLIGVAFILSALSGMILFFAPSGYQGGRNPYYAQPVLFLSTQTWNILHTYSSIAMISGVGAHLVLHWEWMVCMTKRLLTVKRPVRQRGTACPTE
jgi:cytochrome b subunit of formate dehydrogenase